ncbi:MAG: YwiC-like family protein, partial [Fuerstiella sp.]
MSGATIQAVGATAPVRLHPKEHGAYAIVGVPLVVALAIGGLNTVAVLATIATIAGFVANEPLMVLSGRRGERARLSTPSALLTLELLLLTAVLFGSAAFWFGSEKVRAALIACVFFAVAGFAMSAAGWQRTFIAQVTGIIGLTLPSAVVVLAGG